MSQAKRESGEKGDISELDDKTAKLIEALQNIPDEALTPELVAFLKEKTAELAALGCELEKLIEELREEDG